MSLHETFRRIRTLHGPCGPRTGSAAQRYQAPGRGTAQAGRSESEQARPEAETKDQGQSIHFGPRRKPRTLVGFRFFVLLAGEHNLREPLADALSYRQIESPAIVQILTVVEP